MLQYKLNGRIDDRLMSVWLRGVGRGWELEERWGERLGGRSS